MKWLLMILLFVSDFCFAQNRQVNFFSIDWYVQNIEAPTPDSLAKKLTALYQNQLEKTRAIFSWIAQHISYNTGIYNQAGKYKAVKFVQNPYDTVSSKPAIEQTAERVLRRRVAVCDGYAKLFKTLCDYAGLQSEIITGYAKCYVERSEKFRTNHTWNAVKIDGAWQLLDVTWASGYINYANEYEQHIDDAYFLTPPQKFIADHYPEEVKWTLMKHPPAVKEFQFSPLKSKSFVKYGIKSMSPSRGMIEANIGDTIQLRLHSADIEKDKKIASDAFIDSSDLISTASIIFLNPVIENNQAVYTFIVSTDAEWIYLVYNHDPVLLYKLSFKQQKSIK